MEEKDIKITQDLRIMQAIVKEAIGQNPNGGVTIVNIGQIQITISQNNPEKKSKVRPTIEDKKESEPIKAIESKKAAINHKEPEKQLEALPASEDKKELIPKPKKVSIKEKPKQLEGKTNIKKQGRCIHDMVEEECYFCKRRKEGFIEGGKT